MAKRIYNSPSAKDKATHKVLWGWKRDGIEDGRRTPNSRTVYFSADLAENGKEIAIKRAFFFLETRARSGEIQTLQEKVGDSRMISHYRMEALVWDDPHHKGYSRLRITVGEPKEKDLATIRRRLKGKPRLSIPEPRLVPESTDYNLSKYAPFAVCIGSGLSAESGLPLLGKIHNLFEVDNMETGQLVFGVADNLPTRIVNNVDLEFQNFCQFTIDAMAAEPSDSHRMITYLYEKGIIKHAFTDNMDNILEKVNVPYVPTRLSIFPDRFPVKFDPEVKSLLVVGVAVDRRDVIKQARKARLKIIAINPVFGVAPFSRNMDYLCRGDIFFRKTAKEALSKIIAASRF